eukprot:1475633-Prymnesium_polylepis.1
MSLKHCRTVQQLLREQIDTHPPPVLFRGVGCSLARTMRTAPTRLLPYLKGFGRIQKVVNILWRMEGFGRVE